jgi:hemoglobin
MVEDLYELIGGRSTIEAATELFYDKVLQDGSLHQFFERIDMAHLRSRKTPSSMFLTSPVREGYAQTRSLRRAGADNNALFGHYRRILNRSDWGLTRIGVCPRALLICEVAHRHVTSEINALGLRLDLGRFRREMLNRHIVPNIINSIVAYSGPRRDGPVSFVLRFATSRHLRS